MRFADPKANLMRFYLEPGMMVADFGAGSGAYTLPAAEIVGRRGRVYAIDVQQELLSRIQNTAYGKGLENVDVIWGDIEEKSGSGLTEATIDAVIISNTFFLVEDKDAVVTEAARVLKRNGRVLVVDWKDAFGGLGPHPDAVVSLRDIQNVFEAHGFALDREIDAGAHHYGAVFKKKIK